MSYLKTPIWLLLTPLLFAIDGGGSDAKQIWNGPVIAALAAQTTEAPKSGVRSIQFAGRRWLVKSGTRLGPGPNDFSASSQNVWTDDAGHLHLALAKVGDKWQCAEVVADRSLGYGEYRWVISGNLPQLDPQAVLGLFTYENQSREIDFELSRWGDAAKPNAQFVVQPYTVDGNLHRFDTGKAIVLTVSILWRKHSVRGQCWDGQDTKAKPMADWTYTGRSVPPARSERARANLWLLDGRAPTSAVAQEVVIRSFEFKSAGNQQR